MNPKGQNFEFEYDNMVTNRILKGNSSKGISNEILYDEFGNPITTRIINQSQDGTIEDRIK